MKTDSNPLVSGLKALPLVAVLLSSRTLHEAARLLAAFLTSFSTCARCLLARTSAFTTDYAKRAAELRSLSRKNNLQLGEQQVCA